MDFKITIINTVQRIKRSKISTQTIVQRKNSENKKFNDRN